MSDEPPRVEDPGHLPAVALDGDEGKAQPESPAADSRELEEVSERVAELLLQRSDSRQITVSAHYARPTPPAAELARIEALLPGATDRFLRMAEKQQDHAHAMERVVLKTNRWTVRIDQLLRGLGLFAGFAIGIVTVVAGMVTTLSDHPIAGSFIGTGGVAMLAAVFVYGARRDAKAPPHVGAKTGD